MSGKTQKEHKRQSRHRHHRSSYRFSHFRHTVLPILVILLLAALLAVGLFYTFRQQKQYQAQANAAGEQQERERVTIVWNGTTYALRDDLRVLALIGVDSTSEEEEAQGKAGQSDFIALVIVDKTAKTWSLLQLNRDIICDVPIINSKGRYQGMTREQLAFAHSYGSGKGDSCRNTVQAVEKLLYDISVDGFIRIHADSVPTVNRLVGGVSVTIEDDLTALDPVLAPGATVTLSGQQAETFVRARTGLKDPSNQNRMKRQRTYIAAWLEAAKQRLEDGKMSPEDLLDTVSDEMLTNQSMFRLSQLAEVITDYPAPEVYTVKGKSVKGEKYMEFHVDEDALMQQVVDLFYEPLDS